MLDFVFRDHLRLALDAALLFGVGLFAAYPVVRYRLRAPAAVPLAALRLVARLMGRSPGLVRMAAVIWAFNSVVMFLDMASGFHPMLPKVLGMWTGLNVGIMIGLAPREKVFLPPQRPAAGQWVPSPPLAGSCALLVLLLELPCFFFAVAMGLSMGHAVQSGAAGYAAALSVRARAYFSVIVPVLLASALAEAGAIRGAAARAEG